MEKCKSLASSPVSSTIYVKDSLVHGKGLFASRKIKKDEIIGTYQCRVVKDDGPHVLWIDDTAYLVEDDFKYINHNNEANACYYDDFTVVALKDIAADDEIFHYYGEDW